MTSEHEMWMGLALDLARAAAADGEAPVGAIVVKDGRVIAAGSLHASPSRSSGHTVRPVARSEM
jgi:tRNA(adenine34) deaminase